MRKLLEMMRTRSAQMALLGVLLLVTNPELRALLMLGDALGLGLILLTINGYLKLAWQVAMARVGGGVGLIGLVARGLHGLALGRNVLALAVLAVQQVRVTRQGRG